MRIMCLDIGDKRIGIAITDPLGIIASPYGVLKVTNQGDALKEILKIVTSLSIGLVLLGVPYNQDGNSTEQSNKNVFYADNLRGKIKIDFCDERFSTIEAYGSLQEMGISYKKGKKSIDKISASLILQRYLEREKV
ncbi:MAG: putative pre-16S rRNA nuclease [candidate division WS2 bacterium]|nr:putative pre-16S rRNA nuclease [Candidatus Lithacetigena glycinireducens]MBT9174503.1 putative pre-16S rRNA nuclease [Candidatus Lithacetigena glycinireducens]